MLRIFLLPTSNHAHHVLRSKNRHPTHIRPANPHMKTSKHSTPLDSLNHCDTAIEPPLAYSSTPTASASNLLILRNAIASPARSASSSTSPSPIVTVRCSKSSHGARTRPFSVFSPYVPHHDHMGDS